MSQSLKDNVIDTMELSEEDKQGLENIADLSNRERSKRQLRKFSLEINNPDFEGNDSKLLWSGLVVIDSKIEDLQEETNQNSTWIKIFKWGLPIITTVQLAIIGYLAQLAL